MALNEMQKLVFVKTIHTIVWAFFNIVLIYLYYAVIYNQIGKLFWVGIGLILIECIILLANKWMCPLTPIARRYTKSEKANFDIYLPEWFAKHNKTIYTILFSILCVLFVFLL